ncbi:hypothetical protein [Burkholderia sp. RS02]|uniref:DUF4376 domain-containing protein n=1 Tax=unclassified Burkholderia TaxID=2613784 RepID=UPI0032189C16
MQRLINGELTKIGDAEWAKLASEQLAGAKSARIGLLTAACAQAITSGFQSSALGTVHTYPSQPADQQNLSAAVTASQLPQLGGDPRWRVPFMCADKNRVWARRPHTAIQIQQVGADAIAAISMLLQKKDALLAAVEAAQTPEAIDAVRWPTQS